MSTMNITLPDALREFVAMQVATGEFANPDEYIATLIRAEYRRRFESKILQGWDQLERGEGVEMTGADWDQLVVDYKQRHDMND